MENGQGDVLIAWENEAFLSVQDDPDEFEIINPSISVLAQPSVAVVDEVAENRGTEDIAKEYLTIFIPAMHRGSRQKIITARSTRRS